MKLFNTKLFQQLFNAPVATRQELLNILKQAANADVFDKDSMPLIEAVLQFGDMRAKDILLPRHEIDVLNLEMSLADIIQLIRDTGHSRFPVIKDSINNIVGIFHSKDIVEGFTNPESFDLLSHLRKPLFVPDMKPLDSLLYEMKLKHSHMAIIVDEFTNVAGVITLEMIVEQIVGEIDDEHDSLDAEHAIVELEKNKFRVKGFCGLEQLNNLCQLDWHDDLVESVGGYISKQLGRVPQTNEKIIIDKQSIEITSSDSRKINTLILSCTE